MEGKSARTVINSGSALHVSLVGEYLLDRITQLPHSYSTNYLSPGKFQSGGGILPWGGMGERQTLIEREALGGSQPFQ